MKKPKIIAISVAVLAILALVGVTLWILPTFTNRGFDAIAQMGDDERAIHTKLDLIQAAATYADVEALLGPADRSGAGIRPTWNVPKGDALSQVAIYFTDNHATKIRWMKVGSFTWEKILK